MLTNEPDKVPSSSFPLGSSSQEGLNLHWVNKNDLGCTWVPSVSSYSSCTTLNKLMNTFTFTCLILFPLLDIKIFTNIFSCLFCIRIHSTMTKRAILLLSQRLQLRNILENNYNSELFNFICYKDNNGHWLWVPILSVQAILPMLGKNLFCLEIK